MRTADTLSERLAELMVGRKVLLRVARTSARPGETVLDLRMVDGAGVEGLRGIALSVRRGEIPGIGGVSGNG